MKKQPETFKDLLKGLVKETGVNDIEFERAREESKGQRTCDDGTTLYWELNKGGGLSFFSNEVGFKNHVWDTTCVSKQTLLEAIAVMEEIEK